MRRIKRLLFYKKIRRLLSMWVSFAVSSPAPLRFFQMVGQKIRETQGRSIQPHYAIALHILIGAHESHDYFDKQCQFIVPIPKP